MISKKRYIQFVLVAFFFVTCSLSFSQPDTSRFLPTISVTGKSDTIARVSDVTSSVPHYILNVEKLNGMAVQDVGSALKFVPGVQLKDYGGAGGIRTVSFRSLGATHTTVLLDGIRIPNVQSGAINLGNFEIFGVDAAHFTSGQVEQSNAPATAYLSSNVIAIESRISRKPDHLEFSLYSNSTSIHFFEEGFLIGAPLGKKAFLGVQGMTRFGEGDYLFTYESAGINNLQSRTNSGLNQYRVRLVTGFELKKSRTKIGLNYFDNSQELPGAVILYNPTNDQKLWNRDWRFSLQHEQLVGKYKLDLHGIYQSAWLRYYDPNFLNLQGYIDDNYLQQNAGSGFMLRRLISQNRVLIFAGSDIIYSLLNGSKISVSPRRIESNSVIGFQTSRGRLKIESNLTQQLVNDRSFQADTIVSRNFSEWSPFLSLSIGLFKKEKIRLRTFYKHAFTLPTFNDLYYNFIGNYNLRPETANLYNMGISFSDQLKNMTVEFSVDGFYNRVSDKIIAIPTKDLFNWSMQNIGEVSISGFDAGALIFTKIGFWKLTGNASYTYNLSLDKTSPTGSSYNQQIPYTPFHSGTAGLNIARKKVTLSFNGLFTGGRYSLNENTYANYLKPFTDISISISDEFGLFKVLKCNLRFTVLNLLNKNYEVIRSYPMPGRYYQLTIKLVSK